MSNQSINQAPAPKPTGMDRFLNFIEKAGNKIPDPAILFFWLSLLFGLHQHFYQMSVST
ncbi:aminobenzoyl-glutamate transport protein [Vibrio maritimus]|uniref:Aminobenzoyl-glutamate transport protein n=1 Tax=Vibrio maritimus TaxID=990268 RepID=A0A090S589_9VIBR|nr:aminobenzoyl-glutamate transport protein [Vibrio maritimus]